MHEEYRTYNKAVVVINGYTITNTQTKGIPGNKCECHLESITINSTAVGADNPDNIGTTGEVTVIDYSDAVFRNLVGHLCNFLDPNGSPIPNTDPGELCPPIHIEIYTYTNAYIIDASILDWSMQFSGTTPSLSVQWSTIKPSAKPVNPIKDNANYKTPKDLALEIDKIIKESDSKISLGNSTSVTAFEVLDASGNKISLDNTKFVNPDGVNFHMSGKSSGNYVYDALSFLSANMVTSDTGDPFELCERSDNSSTGEAKTTYYLRVRVPASRLPSEDEQTSSRLLFVQNGKWAPFENITFGNNTYVVIPMNSFNFKTSLRSVALQENIIGNINGSTNSGGNQSSGTVADMSNKEKIVGSSPSSQPITISFDCYNVMCFSRNNINSEINFIVYNELGNLHPVCSSMNNSVDGIPTRATVVGCSYSLKSGVVSASVEATMVFNSIAIDVKQAQDVNTDADDGSTDNSSSKKKEEETKSSSKADRSSSKSSKSTSSVAPKSSTKSNKKLSVAEKNAYLTEKTDALMEKYNNWRNR